MRINVAEFKMKPGIILEKQLSGSFAPFDWQGEEISFLAPVRVTMTARDDGRGISVEGIVQTEVAISCSRCLEKYMYPIQTEFKENFRHEGTFPVSDGNEQAAEVEETLTYTGDAIDLENVVMEAIFLSLPMKAVCTAGCRGLCPTCGTNRNQKECDCSIDTVDPRFEVLKKLLGK
ncbi:MAG: YceD family protein [Bacillota bacterium]